MGRSENGSEGGGSEAAQPQTDQHESNINQSTRSIDTDLGQACLNQLPKRIRKPAQRHVPRRAKQVAVCVLMTGGRQTTHHAGTHGPQTLLQQHAQLKLQTSRDSECSSCSLEEAQAREETPPGPAHAAARGVGLGLLVLWEAAFILARGARNGHHAVHSRVGSVEGALVKSGSPLQTTS